jgi:hypothetical protein
MKLTKDEISNLITSSDNYTMFVSKISWRIGQITNPISNYQTFEHFALYDYWNNYGEYGA